MSRESVTRYVPATAPVKVTMSPATICKTTESLKLWDATSVPYPFQTIPIWPPASSADCPFSVAVAVTRVRTATLYGDDCFAAAAVAIARRLSVVTGCTDGSFTAAMIAEVAACACVADSAFVLVRPGATMAAERGFTFAAAEVAASAVADAAAAA